MTSAERRLTQLTAELSARERAILVMQKWLRGEEWDQSLVWKMPPEQRGEYDRICRAIEDANQQFLSNVVVEQLWIYEDEIRLGWLEYASAVAERTARLEGELRSRGVKVRRAGKRARVKANEVVLDKLPDPVHGLSWAMEPLYGQRAKDDGEPDPSGEEMVKALTRSVRDGVERRWKDLCAVRMVLAEMSAALDGYNVTVTKLDEALRLLLARVEHLHASLQRFESFPLPEVDEATLDLTRGWVRMDDIRGVAPRADGTGRTDWQSEYARKQEEERNAAWREQLAAERESREQDVEVFTPGG